MTKTSTREPKPYCNPRVPTNAIDRHLGRVHVMTPDEEIEAEMRKQIMIAREGFGEGAMWTPAIQEQTVRYALWRHRRNREAFQQVMG